MKARNIYAVLASKRKAGSHRKSNKALRKLAKQSRYGEKVSQRTFNSPVRGSNPCAWTI